MGQRGFRSLGQQGGGRGNQVFNRVSPLNRGKQPASGMNTMARQQTNKNGNWSGKYGGVGGGGGGGMKWNGPANSGWTNNNTTQTNNRQFNSRSGPSRNQMYQSHQGSNNFTQGSGQRWGRPNNMAVGRQQGQGGMRPGLSTNHHQGQGQSDGGGCVGQGDLRIMVGHADSQGQGQTRQGLKDMTFDQKHRRAMQALSEARKTIAQLDQQSARQNVVNSRRGTPSQSLNRDNNDNDRYASTVSLASDSFDSSSSVSESDEPNQPIMSFNMASPGSSSRGRHKRWQHKSSEGDHCDSTLTISIDNSAPFVSHSELPLSPAKVEAPMSPYHPPHSSPSQQRSKQHWQQQQQRGRRKQQQRHHSNNNRHPRSAPSSQPYPQQGPPGRHKTKHWYPPQEAAVESMTDCMEMRRGASPGFSRQLADLKPTLAVRYMFQKKTFSAASTPLSLNDRFSEPDDPLGRKVFM
ncbi:hypothetical protein ACOMHN_047170 [Nucella lapillus]